METLINAIKEWVEEIKELLNLKASKTEVAEAVKAVSAASDWNENDESSNSYIKNRPGAYTKLFSDYVVMDNYVSLGTGANNNSYYLPIEIPIFENKPLTLKINGVDQEIRYSMYGGEPCWYCNSRALAIFKDRVMNDYYEPFREDLTLSVPNFETDVKFPSRYLDAVTSFNGQKGDVVAEFIDPHNIVGTGSVSINRSAGSNIGSYSATFGFACEATASGAFAEGFSTKASGAQSHAEGRNSKATGQYAHAEGYQTEAAISGHAEGLNSKALGAPSHAEGSATVSSGNYSHAEGSGSTASGNYSHAEGAESNALGSASHAEGFSATATGNYSHAEGFNTNAVGEYSHAEGKYNISTSDMNTIAHVVGNGTSGTKKSNAYTLDWSGNGWYAGDVYVGSTSGTNKDAGSKKLATEEFVLAAIQQALGNN